MQVKLLAVLAVCLLICGEAASDTAPSAGSDGGPRPPANWKPTGRVLLLPARQQTAQFYGAPPAEFTAARQLQSPPEYDEDVLTPPAEEDGITEIPVTEDYPTTTTETDESSDGFFFNTGDQQKEQPQVTSGVYHVLLPDGRLQRVEYTTAPLKQAAFTKSSQGSNQFTQQNVEQTGFSQQNTRTNQASGQFTFQKPSYQSNQFALNSFKQNQYQENNLAQNSAQVPANGQYRTSHASFSNPPSFYYQQQKEEPKSVYSQTPPKQLEVSNRTTQVKPVFVSVNFGSPQGKPAVSVHVPAQGKPDVNVHVPTQGKSDVNVHVPTQGKSDVNGQTQGKTFFRGQNQDTTATFEQTQGKPDVNGQTQSNSFVSGQNQGTTSGQIVSSYTYPQASYPSYTYQPIEFARQQDARDSTASPFVFNGYLASVEYPGQQPVVQPSPLYYSYSSAPLVRILRRTD